MKPNKAYKIAGYTNKMVVSTGEYRPPKKGEYFLSGAKVEGYLAHNDLSTPYWIAKRSGIESRG